MSAQRCLITVVGSQKQVDLSVPADTPISEYTDLLAGLCAEEPNAELPPLWSLAVIGAGPLPLNTSLAQAGIVDGQTLYLQNLLAGEEDEPVVHTVRELVSDLSRDARRSRWDARTRSRTALLLGALWLVNTVAYLAGTKRDGLAVGLIAVLAGIGLAATARLLEPFPRVLSRGWRVALACGAVPALIIAAVPGSDGYGATVARVTIGALIGSVMAFLAVPEVLVGAMILVGLLAVVGVLVMLAVGASAAASAATTVAAGTLFLAVAPRTAGLLTAASWLRMSDESLDPPADPDFIAENVARVRRVLLLLTGVTSAAVAAGLVVLTQDVGWFSAGLAAVATIALFLRAGTFRFTAEAIGPVIAAAAGAFGLCTLLGHFSSTDQFMLPLTVVVGLAAIIVSIPVLLWRADSAEPEDTNRMSVGSRLSPLLTICQMALVPLVLGVFGVYGTLFGIGNRL